MKRNACSDYICVPPTRAFNRSSTRIWRIAARNGAPRLPASTFVLDRAGLARAMSLPPDSNSFSSPVSALLSRAAGRAAQSLERPPHHARRLPHRRRRLPDSRRQASRARSRLSPPCSPRRFVRRATCSRCLSPRASRTGASLRFPTAAPAGLPGHRNRPARRWKRASSLPAAWSAISISSNASSAMAAIRICPENDAALDVSALDRPHRLRDPRTASGRHEEIRAGPAACERRHRPPAARRHVLERPQTSSTTTATLSSSARRDHRGVMVTIIADNYYGYCKKEVKTQISYAANLFGLAEEEHAGGAIAFATYVLGTEFFAGRTVSLKKATFEQAMACSATSSSAGRRGMESIAAFQDVFYIPEDSIFTLRDGFVRWQRDGRTHSLRCTPRTSTCCPPASACTWKSSLRHGLAPDRLAPARHSLPQAVHGFRRRQVRNLEIHRPRTAERSRVCPRLPRGHGQGRRNLRARFFVHLQIAPTRRPLPPVHP